MLRADTPNRNALPPFLRCATSVFEQQGSVDEKDAKIAHALASASFDSSHNVLADEDVLWEDFKQAR